MKGQLLCYCLFFNIERHERHEYQYHIQSKSFHFRYVMGFRKDAKRRKCAKKILRMQYPPSVRSVPSVFENIISVFSVFSVKVWDEIFAWFCVFRAFSRSKIFHFCVGRGLRKYAKRRKCAKKIRQCALLALPAGDMWPPLSPPVGGGVVSTERRTNQSPPTGGVRGGH